LRGRDRQWARRGGVRFGLGTGVQFERGGWTLTVIRQETADQYRVTGQRKRSGERPHHGAQSRRSPDLSGRRKIGCDSAATDEQPHPRPAIVPTVSPSWLRSPSTSSMRRRHACGLRTLRLWCAAAEGSMKDAPRCPKCAFLVEGKPIELKEGNFDRHLTRSDLPLWWTSGLRGCGPCIAMAPFYEATRSKLEPKMRFAKLNTQERAAAGGTLRHSQHSNPDRIPCRQEIAVKSGGWTRAADPMLTPCGLRLSAAWARCALGLGAGLGSLSRFGTPPRNDRSCQRRPCSHLIARICPLFAANRSGGGFESVRSMSLTA